MQIAAMGQIQPKPKHLLDDRLLPVNPIYARINWKLSEGPTNDNASPIAVSCNISLNHYMEQMLSLRRTMEGSTSGEWSDQEFNVFDGDALIGRILRSQVASSDRPWLWTIAGWPSDDVDNRGYAKNLETALSEIASQWENGGPAAA